jgi:transketolase
MRKKIFLAAVSAGVGHLASAFSCAEIIHALYVGGVLRHDPKNPKWPERDLFILSKGHGSLALYAALADCGYFPESELHGFCQPDTILGGEPNHLETPGVEASTGSLGHGLSIALGMALALKSDARPNLVYCLVGDGECQEGSVWEAVLSAPAFKLDNLIMIIDNNHLQKMDTIKNIIGLEALGRQVEGFGWQVRHSDGHNVADLRKKLLEKWEPGRPCCLIADTIKGKGSSLMENNPAWHWRMPNKKEIKTFCSELDINETELAAAKARM